MVSALYYTENGCAMAKRIVSKQAGYCTFIGSYAVPTNRCTKLTLVCFLSFTYIPGVNLPTIKALLRLWFPIENAEKVFYHPHLASPVKGEEM